MNETEKSIQIGNVTWSFWTDPCGDIVGTCDTLGLTASGNTLPLFVEDALVVMADPAQHYKAEPINVNSYLHYKVVEQDGKHVLLEYNDDACPRMGDREEFTDLDVGTPIASWAPAQSIVLRYEDARFLGVLEPTDGVVCGDDLCYSIQLL